MADPVNVAPKWPQTFPRTFNGVLNYASSLAKQLTQVFAEYGYRVNLSVTTDGVEVMTAPIVLSSYTITPDTTPTASEWTGGLIYVSDETGGATVAFSDGTNWRRVQDRAIIA